MVLGLIVLAIEWILITWIMITTVQALKKVVPRTDIEQAFLIKGIWKLEISLGLALVGLAGLGTIGSVYFPSSFGLLILAVTLAVFVLTYRATKDLEKDSSIAEQLKKIDKWIAKRKKERSKPKR